jgi:hypothetical protein
MKEEDRPGLVVFVILTDGEENSSREYNLQAVRTLITQQKEKFNWDFVFLGANQDAVLTGTTMGFDAGSSMTYDAGSEGVTSMAGSVGRYVKDVRADKKQMFLMEERASAAKEFDSTTNDSTSDDSTNNDSTNEASAKPTD